EQLVLQQVGAQGRAPRRDLKAGVRIIMSSLMANLMGLHQTRPQGSLLVVELERRKRTRYDRPGMRKLADVITVLNRTGYLIRHPHEFRQKRTTIEPSSRLIAIFAELNARPSDVTRADGEELIILTARPKVSRIAGKKQP